ncbi:MAG: nucleoside deaminase [Clostridiaceae bacterium]|nr:nucleoside deaminase [Clostridiaceae bacterium]
MKEAYKEALKAYGKEEVPIGAVIVKDNRVIARAHNERESRKDATLHAEISAIKKACKKLGTWRLNDCDMYVTLEPCVMCAGALIQARIRTVFIGAADPKAGAVGSVINVTNVEKFNHRINVVYGVLEEECSLILKKFFKKLRLRQE